MHGAREECSRRRPSVSASVCLQRASVVRKHLDLLVSQFVAQFLRRIFFFFYIRTCIRVPRETKRSKNSWPANTYIRGHCTSKRHSYRIMYETSSPPLVCLRHDMIYNTGGLVDGNNIRRTSTHFGRRENAVGRPTLKYPVCRSSLYLIARARASSNPRRTPTVLTLT